MAPINHNTPCTQQTPRPRASPWHHQVSVLVDQRQFKPSKLPEAQAPCPAMHDPGIMCTQPTCCTSLTYLYRCKCCCSVPQPSHLHLLHPSPSQHPELPLTLPPLTRPPHSSSSRPGMYSSCTSNMTGEAAGTLGLPAAALRPLGKARLPGMYSRRTPPGRMVCRPSSRPGITCAPPTRMSYGLPLSSDDSNTRPLGVMAT
mmetsp:Transcript_12406/g.30484  ORF Transcript_12406/g.30484 Transcript_12406/m.30484 type:complete len:201 (+) Transcript_12406:98-700(+)